MLILKILILSKYYKSTLHQEHSRKQVKHEEQYREHYWLHNFHQCLKIGIPHQIHSNSLLQQALFWLKVDERQRKRYDSSKTQQICQNEPHQT